MCNREEIMTFSAGVFRFFLYVVSTSGGIKLISSDERAIYPASQHVFQAGFFIVMRKI